MSLKPRRKYDQSIELEFFITIIHALGFCLRIS